MRLKGRRNEGPNMNALLWLSECSDSSGLVLSVLFGNEKLYISVCAGTNASATVKFVLLIDDVCACGQVS